MQLCTLVYLIRDNKVCLGKKARGRGAGYWNGFGGKIEEGETPRVAAARELKEECGVCVESHTLTQVAKTVFCYPDEDVCVHVYKAETWQGEPASTEEMTPAWFLFDTIPYHEMWESDIDWLPRVLAGEKITGIAWFDETGTKTVHTKWQSVSSF